MSEGFTYRNISSSTFGLAVKTVNLPLIPEKRSTSEEVMGYNGAYWFQDGYKTKEVAFKCTLSNNPDFEIRMQTKANIALWLDGEGDLIINYDPLKKYKARVVKQIDAPPGAALDEFVVVFEVQPIGDSAIRADITWDEADFSWDAADFPWGGYQNEFSVNSPGEEITIENPGNYEALPLIAVTGSVSSFSIAGDNGNYFIYTGLSGTVYIDCKNRLIYSISGSNKVNRRSKFAGKYIKLNVGTNTLSVTCTTGFINIKFENFAVYL